MKLQIKLKKKFQKEKKNLRNKTFFFFSKIFINGFFVFNKKIFVLHFFFFHSANSRDGKCPRSHVQIVSLFTNPV